MNNTSSYSKDLMLSFLNINSYYSQLIKRLNLNVNKFNIQKIDLAYQLSLLNYKNHPTQLNYNKIYNALTTANIIAEKLGGDGTTIACCILHLSTTTTYINKHIKEINEIFGKDILAIIYSLKKIDKILKKQTVNEKQYASELFTELSTNIRVVLIELAEQLNIMQNLNKISKYEQIKKALQVKNIFVPIAHRLDLDDVKSELENLYLKYVHNKAYCVLQEKMDMLGDDKEKIINEFCEKLSSILKKNKLKFRIEKRIKSIYSVWNKINFRGLAFEEIYDIIALRIIIDAHPNEEKKLCWKTYYLTMSLGDPKLDNTRDWITTPKENGYESLHITLKTKEGNWVEVQIRTERMHEIASKGCAAHWIYKNDQANIVNPYIEQWTQELKNCLKTGEY
jgi:guanosine-3',5'-bis(diphosphate) 3'-pyrophosphohydrolase